MTISIMPGPQPGGGGGGSAPAAARTAILLGLTGTKAQGTTNTRIVRYDWVISDNGGDDFTMTDSVTLGTYFRIVTPGIYYAHGGAQLLGGGGGGICRRSELLNTIVLINDDYPLGFVGPGGYSIINQSGFFPCIADDYVTFTIDVGLSSTKAAFKFGLIGPF